MARTITLLLILLMIVPLIPESNLTGGEVITGGVRGGMLTNNVIFDREVEISTLSAIRVALTEEGATLLSPGEVNYNLLPGEFNNALMRVPPWLRDETFTSLWEVLAQDPGNGVISLNAEDVDGDGLMDLLVGEDGNYRLFRNIGGAPPRFVEVPVPVAVDLPLHGWFYPYLIDLDSDGDLDLIAGTEDGIFISFNDPSRAHYYYTINLGLVTARRISLSYMGEEYSNVLNGTALIFAMGERMGGVYMLAIKKYSAPDNSLQYVTRLLGRWGVNNTVPFVCRFNIDEIPDILLGDGAGNIRIYLGASSTYLFTMNFNRAGDVEPEFQVGHKPPAPLSPVCFDITWDQIDDLLIGCGDGRIRMYGQTESTVKNTFWDTWERPQDPVVKNYQHPSRLVRPLPLNVESRAEYSYVRALLEAPRREVDELAFTIAHTPRENLLYDPVNISLLLTTNAHLVYQIAEELRYVRLKDVSTPGGVETTAEYRVRFGEVERWITIPSSIYYWYVVHPRVTEEMALWINPETGNYSPPDEGGEFWRYYLYYHADESYPPDPSPEHCYPKDFPPPLLKEVLSGVEIAWDGVPYTAPRGIDNKGRNNTRPFGYRDHAIEAISNWVEKSLPINQQESGDDERPIQPVRIYHTHNGNCGELQDLTVAAARSALIPTRGVLLTGEDHVWSEFYMGGWHQWDNYWSDGGSVVDHFMNYWWEWGTRGGSGVYSWRGDDSVGDVTLHYVPENRSALLRVIVRCGGSVIPGVRVVVLSDWIATHEVGSPVSVPIPSIWNYTDWRGETTFHICCNKFMIRVVSPMGAYTSDMFEVSPGEEKTIYVSYPGRTLSRGFLFYGNATESQKVVDGGGKKYLFIVEPEEGHTLQRNFMTGYWTPQPTPSPPLITVVTTFNNTTYSGWSFKTDEYYFANPIASGGLVIPISLPSSGLIVHLFPPPMFTDIVRYRYRIKVVEVGDGMGAVIHRDLKRVHLLLTNNNGFRDALDSIKVYSAKGEVSLSTPAISPYNQNTSAGYILDNTTYFVFPTWLQAVSLGEDELNSLNLERGRNGIRVEGKAGEESFAASCSLSWNGYPPPKLELLQPPPHTHIPAGTPLKATFHLSGYLEGLSEMALLGFRGVGHHEVGENRTVVIDTSPLHGSVWVKYTTFRDDGTFVSRMVRYAVDAKPPHVSITATPLEVVRGEVVVVHLTLTDDVQLQRFLLKSPGGTVEMNLSGKNAEKEISLNTSSWPLGEANITVQVWDNAGLISSNYTVVSVIPPPDKTPPEVEILSPTNGTKVEAGDYVTLRGRARDDTGLSSLILRGDLGVVDLMPYLSGGEFEVRLATSDENVGEAVLVVAAQDLSGNSATASVRIFIYSERERETNPPVITLLSPQTIPASYPDTVSVEGEVSDDTEVEEVLVSFDMGASWEKLNLLSGRFSIVFNTSYPVEHGLLDPRSDYETLNNYPLYIRATDVWGNREKATVIINVIDNIEPELHVSVSRDNGYLRVNLTFSDNLAVVSGEINFYYSDGEVWRERIPFTALEEGHYEMEIPLSPDQWGDLDVIVEDPAGGKCVKSISIEKVSREVKTKGGGEGGVSLYILVALVALVASLLALLFLLWRREHHEIE